MLEELIPDLFNFLILRLLYLPCWQFTYTHTRVAFFFSAPYFAAYYSPQILKCKVTEAQNSKEYPLHTDCWLVSKRRLICSSSPPGSTVVGSA